MVARIQRVRRATDTQRGALKWRDGRTFHRKRSVSGKRKTKESEKSE